MPLLRTHYINFSPNDLPSVLQPHREIIMERGMIAEKLQILPVECIVRGFMAGSGWKEYQEKGSICGIDLPSGIKLSDKLPHPIFTPSTKAKDGEHDINIHPREIFDILKDWARDNETLKGINVAIVSNQVEKTSLDIYQFAKNYARNRGIFIADTKFEFGIKPGTLKVTLADEILTADSSRFWDINKYCPGRAQDSMDKQPIRDYLESIGWDKVAPMPVLPEEIITETTKKYQELLRLLTI